MHPKKNKKEKESVDARRVELCQSVVKESN